MFASINSSANFGPITNLLIEMVVPESNNSFMRCLADSMLYILLILLPPLLNLRYIFILTDAF